MRRYSQHSLKKAKPFNINYCANTTNNLCCTFHETTTCFSSTLITSPSFQPVFSQSTKKQAYLPSQQAQCKSKEYFRPFSKARMLHSLIFLSKDRPFHYKFLLKRASGLIRCVPMSEGSSVWINFQNFIGKQFLIFFHTILYPYFQCFWLLSYPPEGNLRVSPTIYYVHFGLLWQRFNNNIHMLR